MTEKWNPEYDRSRPTYDIFQNQWRGWTFHTLCEHLGMARKAVKRAMNKRGLTLEARPGHTLTERDIETITAVVAARREERLYGRSQRAP